MGPFFDYFKPQFHPWQHDTHWANENLAELEELMKDGKSFPMYTSGESFSSGNPNRKKALTELAADDEERLNKQYGVSQ